LVITRLKRYVYLAVAVLALCAALLAASPAVAQAQAERVVVRPGDTLWTISTERLGADATPQQIASEAERIYALNRDQIGSDPDLLFPGQELSVSAAGEPSAAPDRASDQEEGRAAEAAAAEAAAPRAPEQPANLPKAPGATPVPAVESPAAASDVGSSTSSSAVASAVGSSLKSVRSSVERAVAATAQAFTGVRATTDGRQQLGLGIIALTLLIGGLMAWKLPMRRRVGDSELWGIYSGYYGDYAYAGGYYTYQDTYQEKTPDLHREDDSASAAAPLTSEPELSVNGSEADALATELSVNGSEAEALATEEGHSSSRVGLGAIARARRERIRRGRARGLKRRAPGRQPRTPKNGRAALFLRRQIINGGR
jgi:LysM domain